MAVEDFLRETTPPIGVPLHLVTDRSHRITAVRGKPAPPVVINLPDGTSRPPKPGEIEFEWITGA